MPATSTSLAARRRRARATASCRPTSATRAAMRARLRRASSPTRSMHLAAESHVDRSIDGPAAFVQTNVVGTFALLRGGARLLARRSTGAAATASASSTSRPTRSSARSAPTGCFTEDDRLRPAARPTRPEGGVRPPGARLAPHLRPAGADHQLLEQLRAVPVPREADPADDPQRARGQAAAGLRRRRERPRLALRRGPLPRALLRGAASAGRSGETYNIGGRNERTNLDVVDAICALLDELAPAAPAGPHARADRLRHRPARPRPPLRHRRRARSSASSAGAPRETLRERAAPDGALVPRQRATGGERSARGALPGRAARRRVGQPGLDRHAGRVGCRADGHRRCAARAAASASATIAASSSRGRSPAEASSQAGVATEFVPGQPYAGRPRSGRSRGAALPERRAVRRRTKLIARWCAGALLDVAVDLRAAPRPTCGRHVAVGAVYGARSWAAQLSGAGGVCPRTSAPCTSRIERTVVDKVAAARTAAGPRPRA